eukprot:scaffold31470_cov33-Prasinocladus_malaysianus.AAC.1
MAAMLWPVPPVWLPTSLPKLAEGLAGIWGRLTMLLVRRKNWPDIWYSRSSTGADSISSPASRRPSTSCGKVDVTHSLEMTGYGLIASNYTYTMKPTIRSESMDNLFWGTKNI